MMFLNKDGLLRPRSIWSMMPRRASLLRSIEVPASTETILAL